MRRQKCLFVVAVPMLAATCTIAAAQDWPQWRGPNRDNVLASFSLPKEWPKELVKKWSTNVGLGDASPSLVGDKVFVFARQTNDAGEGQETMLAVDAKTGDILWQEKQPAVRVSGGAAQHPGPRSTPTVVDGKVYALGVGGVLSCWDANSGQVIWRKDSKEFAKQYPMFFTSMSPIVVDGLCIAHLGAEGNGAIMAFDQNNGEERWRWKGEGPSYGSPVIMNIEGAKLVVMETEKSIVGVSVADGMLKWQHPIKGQPSGTPIIDGNKVIYTAQGTHAIKIEKQDDGLHVEPLWSKQAPAPRFTSPLLKEGYLYGVTSSGNLYCMSAETGEFAWTDKARRGDPTAILDAGPVLLAVSNSSELAAIEPNAKECVELARIKIAESPVWTYPILVGNRVFVKDKESLTLWAFE